MSPVLSVRGRIVIWGLVTWAPLIVFGQGNFPPQEAEYAIIGNLPGEQTRHHLSLNSSGGYLVWQDGRTDGDSLGISARRLNSTLSGEFGLFRVNEQGAGDQENPQVAMLKNGGAIFVWQGGRPGFQKIYARFLAPDGTFATGDVLVNTYTNNYQINPAVASLADGNVVVVWSSADQDGSLRGVYAQRLSPTGQNLGGESRVNTTTLFNQRDATVAALTNGGFVVAWICEKQTNGADRVDVNARVFRPDGAALTGEIQVNTAPNACAQPAAASLVDGGFTLVWMHRDDVAVTNGWDIRARTFSGAGVALGGDVQVNTYAYGDQFSPKIASIGVDQMVVWNSMGQDGSWEGVFARAMSGNNLVGDEFPANATTVSRQIQPVVASDENNRFLVVWSGFVGGDNSFDLYAQRYASLQPLLQPPPPHVAALNDAARLSVTWAELSGYSLAGYEVYMDGSPFPDFTTNNYWVATGLAPGTAHTFTLVYLMSDGQRSRPSDPVTGTTWGGDMDGAFGVPDGLQDDWQRLYWGNNAANWPTGNLDSDGDGASNYKEFLAGSNPADPNSVLKTSILNTPQGRLFTWNTLPGLVYQVQVSTNLATWTSLGLPRFAAGVTDSIPVDGALGVAFYRVLRVW